MKHVGKASHSFVLCSHMVLLRLSCLHSLRHLALRSSNELLPLLTMTFAKQSELQRQYKFALFCTNCTEQKKMTPQLGPSYTGCYVQTCFLPPGTNQFSSPKTSTYLPRPGNGGGQCHEAIRASLECQSVAWACWR